MSDERTVEMFCDVSGEVYKVPQSEVDTKECSCCGRKLTIRNPLHRCAMRSDINGSINHKREGQK